MRVPGLQQGAVGENESRQLCMPQCIRSDHDHAKLGLSTGYTLIGLAMDDDDDSLWEDRFCLDITSKNLAAHQSLATTLGFCFTLLPHLSLLRLPCLVRCCRQLQIVVVVQAPQGSHAQSNSGANRKRAVKTCTVDRQAVYKAPLANFVFSA